MKKKDAVNQLKKFRRLICLLFMMLFMNGIFAAGCGNVDEMQETTPVTAEDTGDEQEDEIAEDESPATENASNHGNMASDRGETDDSGEAAAADTINPTNEIADREEASSDEKETSDAGGAASAGTEPPTEPVTPTETTAPTEPAPESEDASADAGSVANTENDLPAVGSGTDTGVPAATSGTDTGVAAAASASDSDGYAADTGVAVADGGAVAAPVQNPAPNSASYVVNSNNGKIHINGACPATGNGDNAMKQPVYFNTYEEAEAFSIQIAPSQDRRQCGNCW